jgi:KDO2-lipid IV(A) lauroyltransferase
VRALDNNIVKLNTLERLAVLAITVLVFPLTIVPRVILRGLSWLLGSLAYLVLKRRRLIAVGNMEKVREAGFLPESLDPKKTTLKAFRNLSLTLLESFSLYAWGFKPFKMRYSFLGEDHARAALARAKERGGGVVFLTAHVGNWELAPHAVGQSFGVNILSVGRSQGSKIIDYMMIKARVGSGGSFVFKDQGAREMLRTLRSGGAIGSLYDQAAMLEREAAPLTFMGLPAFTNLGPVKLALKTGSVILPLFGRREGDRHVFELFPPIDPPARAKGEPKGEPKGDPQGEPQGEPQVDEGEDSGEDFVLNAAQRLNDVLGDYVQRYPEEWLWGHRRWKTPEGLKTDPRSF